MRLTFVIHSLAAGGAEKVVAVLASHFRRRGFEVTVVTIDSSRGDFHALEPGVERRALDLAGERTGAPWLASAQRLLRLRSAIIASRPDVVTSFLDRTNLLVLLATLGSRLPVVVSERSDPVRQPIGAARGRVRRLLYPRAAAVVMQTAVTAEWMRREVPGANVLAIPNPVEDPGGGGPAKAAAESPRLLFVGRLSWEKNAGALLEAFARVAERAPHAVLRIAGDGPERGALEARARPFGERVRFLGLVRDVGAEMRAADLLLVTSRYEGFPNAVLEAMARGLPVVAFDCGGGLREVVRDGVDGVVVAPDDVAALADATVRLLDDPIARRRLGESAREVRDRFSVERVAARWMAVFEAAAQGRRSSSSYTPASESTTRPIA